MATRGASAGIVMGDILPSAHHRGRGHVPRRAARPPPQGAAVLAGPLLRPADRAGRRQGLPGGRRRGRQLPRLLRRDPDHDDRLQPARGGGGGPGAGGPDGPHLDPVPDPPAGRAGRAGGRAVGDPRRQGVLHQLGQRGQRGGAAAGDHGQAQQPGAGPPQQLPRPVVRGHGGDRQPQLVGVQLHPGQRQLRPRRLPLPQPVRAPARRPVRRGLCRRPARRHRHHHRRAGGLHDRRADPGGRRLRRSRPTGCSGP